MIDAFSFWVILISCIVGTYLLTPAAKRFESYCTGYDKGYLDGQKEKERHTDARI